MVGSRCMMVIVIFSQLLLMILLLQAAEENREWREQTTPKSDGSELYQEFCLHVPKDPHWTSSPGKQLPTTSSSPRRPKQPSQVGRGRTQMSEETTQPDQGDLEVVVEWPTGLLASMPEHVPEVSDCHCNAENKKKSKETARVRSLSIQYPSKTCGSTEYIETLEDGRRVCAATFSLVDHFFRIWAKPTTKSGTTKPPSVPSTVPQSTAAELFEHTESSLDIQTGYGEESFDLLPTPSEDLVGSAFYTINTNYDGNKIIQQQSSCRSCYSFTTNFDHVDPNAVKFLVVEVQPGSCSVLIHINLKDKTAICSDLSHTEKLLQKVEIPPPQEENVKFGCICYKKAKKRPDETSSVSTTKIWTPRKKCSSSEFIETLDDGREVCVTPSSLATYLETLKELHVAQPKKNERQPISHIDDFRVNRNSESGQLVGDSVKLDICIFCRPKDWSSIQPEDVQSLQMDLTPSKCPTLITIHLTDGMVLCMDSSNPEFMEQLKKLESPQKSS